MVQRVLALADVEGVAIGEEGLSAVRLDKVHQNPGIVRAQIGKVADLAKMDFDSGKFVFKVDLLDPRPVSYTHLDVYKRQGLRLAAKAGKIKTVFC